MPTIALVAIDGSVVRVIVTGGHVRTISRGAVIVLLDVLSQHSGNGLDRVGRTTLAISVCHNMVT